MDPLWLQEVVGPKRARPDMQAASAPVQAPLTAVNAACGGGWADLSDRRSIS